MRKLGLIAATVVASVGVAAVAQAVDVNQTVAVKVTGKKGTKKKPTALKLDVTTGTSAKDLTLNGTFATKSAIIHFDKNLVFNPTKFPTCDIPTVTSTPDDCPKGSEVGKGVAEATLGSKQVGSTKIKLSPTIRAFNTKGGKLALKLTKAAGDAAGDAVLTGTLKKDSGKYGVKLDVVIPAPIQMPADGLFVTLTKFNTTISSKKFTKGGKKYGYATSVGCPANGKYNFGGDFAFTDGSSAKVKSTTKC